MVTSLFQDSVLGSEDAKSGLAALSHNLLGSLGFKVLTIEYKDINLTMKKIDRVKVLENKLKTLLNV